MNGLPLSTTTLDSEGPYTIRRMVEEDVGKLAMKLAANDLRELEMLDTSPFEAMREGFQIGSVVGVMDGEPEAAFGINSRVYPAAVWFLGSEKARTSPRAFQALSKRWVEMWARRTAMANIVPQQNLRTIRWLKSLDFEFEDRVYTVNGHAFLRFYRGPLTTSLLH